MFCVIYDKFWWNLAKFVVIYAQINFQWLIPKTCLTSTLTLSISLSHNPVSVSPTLSLISRFLVFQYTLSLIHLRFITFFLYLEHSLSFSPLSSNDSDQRSNLCVRLRWVQGMDGNIGCGEIFSQMMEQWTLLTFTRTRWSITIGIIYLGRDFL